MPSIMICTSLVDLVAECLKSKRQLSYTLACYAFVVTDRHGQRIVVVHIVGTESAAVTDSSWRKESLPFWLLADELSHNCSLSVRF